MVSAGVMGSNFLTVNPSAEISNVETSDSKTASFEDFMDSAKTDTYKEDVNVGATRNDKSEEIKNLFEKSNVNQSTAPEKITEEQIVEAAEDAVADLIKNVVEIVSEVMGIDKQDVENAIKDLELSADALLSKNGLSELMKQLTGKENVVELLTNSELSDMFKNIVEQVDELSKLFMETNSINKDQLMEMVSDIDIKAILSEDGIENIEYQMDEVEPNEEAGYQIKEAKAEGEQTAELVETEVEINVTKNTSKADVTPDNNGNDMSQNNQTLAQSFTESLVNAVEELDVDMDVEPQQIIRQIVDEIRVSVNENVRSIEMQLNPESLGKLNIQRVSKNGEVTANIMAQTEAVKEVIESQVTMLKETLLEQGVKIEAVEVVVANRSFDEDFENQGRQDNEQKSKKHISQKELDEINGIQSVQDILEEEMMKQNGNTVSIKA